MKHFDEETYGRICRIYGGVAGGYYKTRQEALETIDAMIDYCQGKIPFQVMLDLLDIAYPHSAVALDKKER